MTVDNSALLRRIDSLASGMFENQKAIEKNSETTAKELAEITGMLKDQNKALFGNGEPDHGMLYRLTWVEKLLKLLIVVVGLNVVLTCGIVIVLFLHLVQ